jgi:hypothetical protein
VGVSAGTVASFSLIGWTFTRGLYDGGNGTEPLEFDSETVIIEAEETPEGVAGGDDELEGLVEPDSEPDVAASPVEPRAELVQDGDEDAPEAPGDDPAEERTESEETEPPQLVPVDEEDGDCGHDEAALWPEAEYGEEPVLRPLLETPETTLDAASGLDIDIEPSLMFDTETSPEPDAQPGSEPGPAPDLEPGPGLDGEPDPALDSAIEPALGHAFDPAFVQALEIQD